MDIFLVNETTLLSDNDAFNIAWACDYQLRYHFGRAGWRSDCRCVFLPGGAKAKVPARGAILHLLDTSDQQGALGYHDEDGNEIPRAIVGVQTARQDGDAESEVASHEALELAADPNVNLAALTSDGRRLYALETADAVQGYPYDVGAPQGRTTGVTVANFVLPSYFDPNTQPAAKVDFLGRLQGPFTLAPQGYASFVDLTDLQAGWQQEFGEKRSELPAWANRAVRRQPIATGA